MKNPISAPQLSIQKIYTKDISFEAISNHNHLEANWSPNMDINLSTRGIAVGENFYEVELSIKMHAKDENKKTCYVVEVVQAGVFHMQNVSKELLDKITATSCANMLFPFCRQIIATLILQGGFPPFLLSPINFEKLYQENLDAQRAKVEDDDTTHPQKNTKH